MVYDRDNAAPPMFTDMQKCRHIIQNIIGNAVKFTDRGHIRISTQAVGNLLRIQVEDTGIGIAPEQIDHIFEEFRQADETPSRHKDGAGLGLAIAKKYAELLGGTIDVSSTHGTGPVFTISLPIVLTGMLPKAADGFETPIRKTTGAPAVLQGRRILIIEDSQPAIIQIRDILETQGYVVDVAQSGKEALKSLSEHQPDGIILDLMMPEMDGFEVVSRIRSDGGMLIPILILTAKHITREELAFLKGNHISQLIQKGAIDKNDLLDAVRDLVAGEREGSAQPPASIKPSILLIEDNPDNRVTVKALLEDHYDICEAKDGMAGIEEAKNLLPDLILLDISLPGMDGFHVLDKLKSDKTLASVPVVALTARAMAGDREEILAYGFDGYVSKPISETQIHDQIRRLLDERK
jgi:CheY-like chemotaxis protein/anti-sigma regulatory factor (Ser/Thr protein kinase)